MIYMFTKSTPTFLKIKWNEILNETNQLKAEWSIIGNKVDVAATPRTVNLRISLTGGVGANVDNLALGAVHLVLIGGWQLGPDHDGVLRPGLEGQDEVPRLNLLLAPLCGTRRRVHVRYHPTIGAAGVLSVKLSHVLKGSDVGQTIWQTCVWIFQSSKSSSLISRFQVLQGQQNDWMQITFQGHKPFLWNLKVLALLSDIRTFKGLLKIVLNSWI